MQAAMLMHGRPDRLVCEPSSRFSIVQAVEEEIARRDALLERDKQAIFEACSSNVFSIVLVEQLYK